MTEITDLSIWVPAQAHPPVLSVQENSHREALVLWRRKQVWARVVKDPIVRANGLLLLWFFFGALL